MIKQIKDLTNSSLNYDCFLVFNAIFIKNISRAILTVLVNEWRDVTYCFSLSVYFIVRS